MKTRLLGLSFLCAWALSSASGCVTEEAVTQVVVAVDVAPALRNTLSEVRAELYSTSGGDAVEQRSFALTAQGTADTFTPPFSFGIVKTKADRFLLVISGYRADQADAVIEHKTIASFQDGKKLFLRVYLDFACYQATCASRAETCRPQASGAPRCVAVEESDELQPFRRGLDTAPSTEGSCATSSCTTEVVCDAGQYIRSGMTGPECASCESGTFSAQQSALSCARWSTCDAGSYVTSAPSVTADRGCAPCEQGTTTSGPNQSTCLPPGSCQAGSEQTAPATATSEATCRPCAAGEHCAGGTAPATACGDDSWDHDADPSTACVPRTDCLAGQYVSAPGSATEDRQCAKCELGLQTTTTNAPTCLSPSSCQAGSEQTAPATSSVAAVCRVCSAGEYCAGGSAPAIPCGNATWDHDGDPKTDCIAKTSCSAGQRVASAGDAKSNRTCEACTSGFSTGTNATSCTAWTTCNADQDEQTAPSPTRDRICLPRFWTKQFGATATGGRVVTDSALAIYGSGCNCKLDRFGADIWTATGVGGALSAIDSTGASYAIGQYWNPNAGGGRNHATLIKISSTGQVVWTERFGNSSQDTQPLGVGVDGQDNVYVAGYNDGLVELDSRALFLRKYASDQRLLWSQTISTVSSSGFGGLAVDAAGGAYIAGSTKAALANNPNQQGSIDGFVMKYDATGFRVWTAQFGSSNRDDLTSVAVDSIGNVYFAGYSWGSVQSGYTNQGGSDVFVGMLGPAGNGPLWIHQFGGAGSDFGSIAGLDASRSVYVSWGSNRVLTKVTPAGSAEWTHAIDVPIEWSVGAVTVDRNGYLFLSGTNAQGGYLIKSRP